jgi:hypothetical protein
LRISEDRENGEKHPAAWLMGGVVSREMSMAAEPIKLPSLDELIELVKPSAHELQVIQLSWELEVAYEVTIRLEAVIYDYVRKTYDELIMICEYVDYENVWKRKLGGENVESPVVQQIKVLGVKLAAHFKVPFVCFSPHHPESRCPYWWERHEAIPCVECGVLLMQDKQQLMGNQHECDFCFFKKRRQATKQSPNES